MSGAIDQPLFRLDEGWRLILASSSPRRRQFFTDLGLPFACWPPKTEPIPEPGCDSFEYVCHAAKTKALECRHQLANPFDCVVIGADTVVILDGKILGKPKSHAEALEMLRAQNGKASIVASAACIILPTEETIAMIDQANVVFRRWPYEVLASYAYSSEPMDKAGAFAIQGTGSFLIDRIEGNFTTVVGLPGPQIISVLLEKNIISPGL